MHASRRFTGPSCANGMRICFGGFASSTTKQPRRTKLTKSYIHGASNVSLLDKTVGHLVDEQAEKFPDRELFVLPFQNIRKTYSQFKQDVDSFGAGLVELGLRRGDRVGMWGPNSYEWLISQFATAKAGLILVTVNPGYRASELEYCLNKVQAKALIAPMEDSYLKILHELSPNASHAAGTRLKNNKSTKLPSLDHLILISDKSSNDAASFSEVQKLCSNDSSTKFEKLARRTQFDDAVNIQFTSGTTGNPKGSTLTHHNIVNNAYFFGRRLGYADDDTKICSPVPLYHCFGCVLGSLAALVHGATMVVPAPRFHAEETLKAIDMEKCTVIYGVPTMYTDQIHHENFKKYDTRSLTTAFMSGAPCPVELLVQVKEKMSIKEVMVGYGMTETSPISLETKLGDSSQKCTQTVGTALDHVEVKLTDEHGAVVPVGEKGEIQVRGYHVMKGYWEDDTKTDEFLSGTKWAVSGDLGVMDEDGYVKIVGRTKDVIIRGGENVFPAEIENCLLKHPDVAEAHIVGVPDKRLGEEICCWIKLKSDVSEEELSKFCKDNLARFKVPKYFVYLDESTAAPLTVTGKVQKFKMREQSITLLKLEGVHDSFQSESS